MDGSRIRNKTVSFSFENGIVWTGSKGLKISDRDQRLNFNVIVPLKKNHSTGFENLGCFLKLKTL